MAEDIKSEETTEAPQTPEALKASKIKSRKSYYETRYDRSLEDADKENAYFRSEQYTTKEIQSVTDENGEVTKPLLTLNHIKPHINFLRGEQSVNRYYFKVIVADEVNKEETVEYDGQQITMDDLAVKLTAELKKAEESNDGEYEISDCFLEGISGGGRSYLEIHVDVDESDFPYKKQVTLSHRTQKNCFPDPDHKKYDLSDCKDFIKMSEYTKDDLKSMIEGKDDVINGLTRTDETLLKREKNDDNDLNYTETDSTSINPDASKDATDESSLLVLIEYYDYQWVEEYMVISGEEAPRKIPKSEYNKTKEALEQQAMMSMQDIAMNPIDEFGMEKEQFKYGIFKLKRPEWYISSYVSGTVLEIKKLEVNGVPVSRLPFAEYGADVAKYIDEISQKYISATKDMISPQDLHNKGHSSALEHLTKSVNSGLWAEGGALVDKDHWEDFGSSGGFIGEVAKGKVKDQHWGQLHPMQLSQGHVYFAQAGAEEMRYIMNINLNSRGQEEKAESGRAKAIDVRQGERGTNFYYDNLRRTKHVACKVMVEYICALKGCDRRKIKIVVDDARQTATARIENQGEINRMLETGAMESAYGDLVIGNMNFNNRDEWVQRWQETNAFAQWMQEEKMKAEAEQMAIADARKSGVIPKEGAM